MVQKKVNIWYVNLDNIVISNLKTKISSKYLIGYFVKVMSPLVLILPKMKGYVKTFKVNEKTIN